MNGFEKHGLDEGDFEDHSGLGAGLRTFDAFPKTKPTYTSATRRGGQWTVFILTVCTILTFSELLSWFRGQENHHFSVEKGISEELQLNMDLVVAMPCDSLRVNVQDAVGDRVLAGELLTKESTSWKLWNDKVNTEIRDGVQEYQTLNAEHVWRKDAQEEDQHVGHLLGEHRSNPRRKFPKSPRMRWGDVEDSCRVYGSLEGNKVQGDFHITARGHGYMDLGHHLDHSTFNFSHMITELSFGPHYPSILNPLDKTISTTDANFYKYQYYLSIVPTTYTRAGTVDPYSQSLPDSTTAGLDAKNSKNTIFTNQYAATSQSRAVNTHSIPGIFFKYNIEPILLIVSEERGSFLSLAVRLVNVVSGVLVAGGWLFQLSGWFKEVIGRRRRQTEGVLHGRHAHVSDEE